MPRIFVKCAFGGEAGHHDLEGFEGEKLTRVCAGEILFEGGEEGDGDGVAISRYSRSNQKLINQILLNRRYSANSLVASSNWLINQSTNLESSSTSLSYKASRTQVFSLYIVDMLYI